MSVNSTYEPGWAAVASNRFPHLQEDGSFYATKFDPESEAYYYSLYSFPIFLCCIGICFLFYFHFISFFCRCECCQIAIKVGRHEKLSEDKVAAIEKQRWKFICRFWCLFVICLVVDHGFWFANELLSDGLGKNYDTMGWGREFLANITIAADAIYVDALRISYLFAESEDTCSQMLTATGVDVNGRMTYIAETIDEYSAVLDDGPPLITDIEDLITKYDNQKEYMLFVVYGLILALLVFYAISAFLRSKFVMFINMSTSGGFVLCALVLCCFEMILLTIFGDYCQDPTGYIIEYGTSFIFDFFLGMSLTTGQAENVNTLLNYYLVNCNGPSPAFNNTVGVDILSVQSTITSLVETDGPCENNQQLVGSLVVIGDLMSQIDLIRTTVQCPPLQFHWAQAIEDGFCTDIVSGLFVVLMIQFALAFFLFLLSLSADLMSFHFGDMWHIKKGYSAPVDDGDFGDAEDHANGSGGKLAVMPVADTATALDGAATTSKNYSGIELSLVTLNEENSFDFSDPIPNKAQPESTKPTTANFVAVPKPAAFHKKLSCEVCLSIFVAASNPRHHCRNCGKSVCGKHSSKFAVCPAFPGESAKRVCDECCGALAPK